jgi:hypothetical protein
MRRRVANSIEDSFRRLRLTSTSKKWNMFFFRPVMIFNTVWPVSISLFHYRIRLRSRKVVGSQHLASLICLIKVYIVLPRTFGWYKTCDCVTSNWSVAAAT